MYAIKNKVTGEFFLGFGMKPDFPVAWGVAEAARKWPDYREAHMQAVLLHRYGDSAQIKPVSLYGT